MMVLAEGGGVLVESGAVYGRTEIRNNRGGKQLAAKQVVKTSEARGRPAQGLAVKGGERGGREGGRGGEEAGVYRASVGVWSADLQMLG